MVQEPVDGKCNEHTDHKLEPDGAAPNIGIDVVADDLAFEVLDGRRVRPVVQAEPQESGQKSGQTEQGCDERDPEVGHFVDETEMSPHLRDRRSVRVADALDGLETFTVIGQPRLGQADTAVVVVDPRLELGELVVEVGPTGRGDALDPLELRRESSKLLVGDEATELDDPGSDVLRVGLEPGQRVSLLGDQHVGLLDVSVPQFETVESRTVQRKRCAGGLSVSLQLLKSGSHGVGGE